MAQNTKKQPLIPAYLVVGEDALKRAAVLKRLRERLAEFGDLSFNSDTFDGETALGSDIVSACNTMPFASDMRLVYVRDADRLKKADAEELVAYLASPSEQTVLALEAEKLAKNTRLYKAIASVGKSAIIDCEPKKKRDLPQTVRSMAVSHGVTFTEGAASALVDLVGENTVHLDSEVAKIALAHRGADPVSEHEVRSLVSRTTEATPWDFVNAFAARDLKKCLLLRTRMKSISPHALIAMCATRLRELLCAKVMEQRGSTSALAAALSEYAKIGNPKARPKQAWQVKDHITCARRFTREELRGAIIAARDTERAMKSGADPEAAFQDWVVMVCSGR